MVSSSGIEEVVVVSSGTHSSGLVVSGTLSSVTPKKGKHSSGTQSAGLVVSGTLSSMSTKIGKHSSGTLEVVVVEVVVVEVVVVEVVVVAIVEVVVVVVVGSAGVGVGAGGGPTRMTVSAGMSSSETVAPFGKVSTRFPEPPNEISGAGSSDGSSSIGGNAKPSISGSKSVSLTDTDAGA